MKKILILGLLGLSSLYAMSNLDLAKNADKKTEGFGSSVSQTKMILINASGQKSIRKMQMNTLEGDKGDKTLSIFISPADIKGTKTLTHEKLDKDDDQWLYLPALKRIKRIASRNKSGSFMGSEFSYEDIGTQNYQKFIYEGNATQIDINGTKLYKSTRIPKDKNSGYTKQILYIDTKDLLVRKIEYYDRKSELLKIAIFEDYQYIDGIARIGKITMQNIQNDKSTIIIWESDKIKVGLKDKDFNKRELKK